MYIYNPENYQPCEQLILNPDLPFHTPFDDENLNHFFRTLTVPKNVQQLVSIYIEYEFVPYIYEKYPDVYFKASPAIQDTLRKKLNFGDAHLFHTYNNAFYIVMFNVSEEQLITSFNEIYRDLKKRKTIYHQHESEFRIYCGVYFSNNLRIDPVDFYKSARHKFSNTQLHRNCFISILNMRLQ